MSCYIGCNCALWVMENRECVKASGRVGGGGGDRVRPPCRGGLKLGGRSP